MHERLTAVGVIAPKYEAEKLSKFIIDSAGFEPLDLTGLDKMVEEAEYYSSTLKLLSHLYDIAGEKPSVNPKKVSLPIVLDMEELMDLTNNLKTSLEKIEKEEEEIRSMLKEFEEDLETLALMKDINATLSDLSSMNFTKIIFAKVHKSLYERILKTFSGSPVVIDKIFEAQESVYFGLIFPVESSDVVLRTLSESSVKIYKIPNYDITPMEAFEKLYDEKKVLEFKLEELEIRKKEIFYSNYHKIQNFYNEVFVLKHVYDFVKKCGVTKEFIVMKGWATEKTLNVLRDMQRNGSIALFENINMEGEKPTLLKNPKFFKPFEMLVKMYGIPRSDEIDPTPIIGILFLFFYGMMFGDVGHGLVISALSLLLYKKTKGDLWYILSFAGLSSAFFGLLYGSIFGFEVIKPLFARPMSSINLFLMLSIIIGAVLIVFGMILNIINRFNRKETKEVIYDPNGFAGLGFYLIAVTNVFWFIQNGHLMMPVYVFFGLLLFFIFLMFLYSVLFEEGSLGERITLAFFETFDRLISFFSNTLSFIRLGAFAMNHAGLFLAFYIMAQMSNSKFGSFLSLLLGNILLIFLEGLVVFIQAVRLEFYEFFSKFYSGDGREFKPVGYQQEVK